ncbi:MAG: hypothetical protein QOI06_2847 [Nocardioidaceae bacterium]|nr:hypothetical protein [Nocardioidaceae bacterium]
MTTVRRYVFAFVAVCAAFAAGIALGNGPLQGTVSAKGDSVSLAHANARLSDEVVALQQDQAFSLALGRVAGPALLSHQLENTAVGVFVLPGIRTATVTGVTRAVTEAGGEVSVLARISPTLVDPGKKAYVDSVATNSLKGVKDLASAASMPTYGRIGTLFARAYTGTSDSLAVDGEATRIDAQLQGARLVSLRQRLQRRASAVIVLAPGDHGAASSVYAAHQIELQLVDAVAAQCDGVLVAAPATSSDSGGLIFQIATSTAMTNAVSTLNVVGTAPGQIAAVGALAASVAGQPGSYGMKGSVPALPPVFTRAH